MSLKIMSNKSNVLIIFRMYKDLIVLVYTFLNFIYLYLVDLNLICV